jgi:hypothetical protein
MLWRRAKEEDHMRRPDRSPTTDSDGELERALRAGYLQFLPRLAKAHLLVLRAASGSLGWDFSEDEWRLFARAHDLPVASTFARSAGGGSFALAKFLAAVGPLPPHSGGSRFSVPRQVIGWDAERLLLGALTVARINGSWPPRDRFDDAARKARDRGVEVPLIKVIDRGLELTYKELQLVAETLAKSIARERGERYGFPPTYSDADAVARGLALAVELLEGDRPSSDVWDVVTRPLRKLGVPVTSKINRTFPSWHAAWAHVERLGLDPGVQADERPRYRTEEAIARGMATAEDELGYRPTPTQWTDAVRDLKRTLGPGIIPAKPTIYTYFPSWKAAWACVKALRARGLL